MLGMVLNHWQVLFGVVLPTQSTTQAMVLRLHGMVRQSSLVTCGITLNLALKPHGVALVHSCHQWLKHSRQAGTRLVSSLLICGIQLFKQALQSGIHSFKECNQSLNHLRTCGMLWHNSLLFYGLES